LTELTEINAYGDLLHHEFVAQFNVSPENATLKESEGFSYTSPYNVIIPDSMDWRDHGAVTKEMWEGECGARVNLANFF